MKFFLDTANLEQIRQASEMGIIDGVTTNPSLIAREGISGKMNTFDHYLAICKLIDGAVSAEVIATDSDGMISEGRELAKLHPNIVVKVPCTEAGIKAAKKLSDEGIRINCTLIFTQGQALLAAKAGVTYASPFAGRLDDISSDGMALVEKIVALYKRYAFKTQVIASSIRHTMHIIQSMEAGAHVATCPLPALLGLLRHPLTDAGVEKFLADYRKLNP